LQSFSAVALLRHAFSGHRSWLPHWRKAAPRPAYKVVIVGGGGHGLATAYYLAKRYGVTDIAVLEQGWIGGGNTGRNTTIVRSNYLQDASAAIYDHALAMWKGLGRELNFNVMYSPRGVISLAHTIDDLHEISRRGHAIRANGIDSEYVSPAEIKRLVPIINLTGRFPVLGGLLQRRGGTVRHDAVAWGYARAADALGVDIVENCAVTGFRIEGGRVLGVETTRGAIAAERVGVVVAGHCSVLADMAGFRLPIQTVPLQAFVSEPLKPLINTVVMSNTVHCYINQSDKGELVMGGAGDAFLSYAQRGGFDCLEHATTALLDLFPILSRLRMMRQWAGITDITQDRSPILSRTPVENLYFNCGWGTGGFKATPASGDVFAWSIAHGRMHPIAAPFSIERHFNGALIEEEAAAGVSH
jgi:sarcosine oxidase subunit beta